MDLIELKRHLKNKKPSFVQREGHKRKKLEEKWKRPKGLHNKLRMGFKSHGMAVSIGYGTPLKNKKKTRKSQGLKMLKNRQKKKRRN